MAPGPAVPAAAACPGGRFEEWDSDSSGPLAVPPAIRSRTTLPPSTAWFCTYSLLEFAVLKHMAGEEVSAGCPPYTHTPPCRRRTAPGGSLGSVPPWVPPARCAALGFPSRPPAAPQPHVRSPRRHRHQEGFGEQPRDQHRG